MSVGEAEGAEPLLPTYSHQENRVDTQLPLLGKHDFYFSPEDTCAHAFMPGSFAVTELLRLWEEDADQSYTNG